MLKRRRNPTLPTLPYQGRRIPAAEVSIETFDKVLVLFDVDGTLLTRTAPLRIAAWNAASASILGVTEMPLVLGPDGFGLCFGIRISGMGDLELAHRIVRHSTGTADGVLARQLVVAETAEYLTRLDEPGVAGVAQPGARRFLEALGSRGARCSVVSGNSRAVSTRKLEAAGVAELFVGHGAFGDEGEYRSDMLTVAVARDGAPGDRVCYVADSPRDVTAGRTAGVPVLAVTSGGYTSTQLAAATYVLENLDDLDLALAAVAAAAMRVPGMQGGLSALDSREASARRALDK